MKPLAVDLFAGLGGWTEGLLAEGYYVVGFDVEQHVYGDHRYPAQLVVQDVLTLHGSQFRNAALIVASPPCQKFSYMAMPWTRAKEKARLLREGPPEDRARLTALFDACFRIQREACEAAGRHIPLVVENVRGAQPWVGRARWAYGSFYLWGDVPALMPMTLKAARKFNPDGTAHPPGKGQNPDGRKTHGHVNKRDGHTHARHLTNQAESDGVKQPGICGPRANGKGDAWFQDGAARHGSKSSARKAASAMIAKIPLPLSRHIAATYRPAT